MGTTLTTKSASLTELQDPGKVLAHADGVPVAILNGETLVAYLVPTAAVHILPDEKAADGVVAAILTRRRQAIAPGLEFLEDK